MTDKAISPLRRRLIEDMTIRRLSPKTQLHYIRHVKRFADFLDRSADKATAGILRAAAVGSGRSADGSSFPPRAAVVEGGSQDNSGRSCRGVHDLHLAELRSETRSHLVLEADGMDDRDPESDLPVVVGKWTAADSRMDIPQYWYVKLAYEARGPMRTPRTSSR